MCFDSFPDHAHWPLAFLLARGTRADAEELLARDRRKPAALRSWIASRLCAGMTLWLLERHNLRDSALAQALLPLDVREFARSAQVQAALALLDARVKEPVVLIKGSATGRLYPRLHLRQMRDIDALLPVGAFRRLAAGDWLDDSCVHLRPVVLAGVPVELHQRFTNCPRWGRFADLAPGCCAVPDLAKCRVPPLETAYTISLLHFFQHVGRTTFDLLDMRMIAATDRFSWEAAQTLWDRYGLWHLALPGLIAAARIGAVVPDEVLARCARQAGARHRRLLPLFFSATFGRRMRTLKRLYCEAVLADAPPLRYLGRRLRGSSGATWVREGLQPGQSGFGWHHYVVAPLRRLARGLFH